jgi:spore coat protein JC
MWIYEKKLEVPVRVSGPNPRLASYVISQYGGPEGELSASLRYLNQRYSMPTGKAKGVLTDIGTEELAHMEIVATLVYKLMENASVEQIKAAGWGSHYADHDKALYWQNAAGVPWVAAYVSATGDPVADLHENLAAEQKARAVYENLIRLSDDPQVNDVLRWLREREVVHYQRFGETLMDVQEYLKSKKYY